MADGLNRVMLMGNLGADPEVRFTQGGQAVCHIRLATTESYLDKDKVRQERTDWHNVTIWGKRGEALGKILAKGSKIFVEGSLRTSSYDNREGQKVYKTEVIASNVILAGGGSRGGEDEGGYGGDDRGQGQSRGGGGRQQRQSAPRGDDGYGPPPGGGGGGGGGGYSRGGGNGGGAARAPAAPPDPEPGFGDGGGEEPYGANGPDSDIPF